MLIAFSFLSMKNFAIGEETYPTNATVLGTAPLIDGYVVIMSNNNRELWNSSTSDGVRSDSYIEEAAGEKLQIYAYITDADGFYTGSHTVEGVLRDITNGHSTTLYLEMLIDTTTALFTGEITIYNSMAQDIAKVNITCYDYDDNILVENNIFSLLYVNPITSSSFNPDQINWAGLYKGTDLNEADGNPYVHTFSATCLGDSVNVGYNLSISGTDLVDGQQVNSIPIENMSCSFDNGDIQSLSESYTQLNLLKLSANLDKNLDFSLSVPADTPKGSYSGSINLLIEPED